MNKKAERGHATRNQLVSLAVRLFAEHGYEGTSVDMVLRESGLSRGALYHHFAGKEALFAGALEAVEAQVSEDVAAAARQLDDPRAALRAGCLAWIRLAREPEVRQIVLVDAPSVVGWHRWREIEERYGFGLLKGSLQMVARSGGLPPELVDPFAHMLLAAMNEIALVIANAPDGDEAIRQGEHAVDELLNRLLPG
ncbi:MAG: TetR/AcrR family transcriptional regulator [Streptomycetaceae bacterium]|nr:TetR/AcrR family transcriptional regulator [Streptomycetaceae bacterium]